jgi:hypothetical protein
MAVAGPTQALAYGHGCKVSWAGRLVPA